MRIAKVPGIPPQTPKCHLSQQLPGAQVVLLHVALERCVVILPQCIYLMAFHHECPASPWCCSIAPRATAPARPRSTAARLATKPPVPLWRRCCPASRPCAAAGLAVLFCGAAGRCAGGRGGGRRVDAGGTRPGARVAVLRAGFDRLSVCRLAGGGHGVTCACVASISCTT